MIPAQFEYSVAQTVDEAISLLQKYGDEAKLLAGGHSLLPIMKLRLAQPRHLVDISRIPGLRGVRREGDVLVIGALTTHHELETSSLLQEHCPLVSQTAREVGDTQIRNRGTIGGSLAHADPAADYPAMVLALEAQLSVAGPQGSRTVPALDFFHGFYTTDLAPDEILTEIRVPVLGSGTGTAYGKWTRRACDFAVVGVAAVVEVEQGTIRRAAVALTGVGEKAVRASAVEQALSGRPATEDSLREAAQLAAEGLEPPDDLNASADFRRHLARVMTRRVLAQALQAAVS